MMCVSISSSFAPFSSKTRQYPYDSVYNYINDQSPTRENYQECKNLLKKKIEEKDVPMVGQYNNDAGLFGAGPAFPSGGFISE